MNPKASTLFLGVLIGILAATIHAAASTSDRFAGVLPISERILSKNSQLAAFARTNPRGSRIAGGQAAFYGQFPHQVAIFADFSDGNRYFCGGSTLNSFTVLTTAHCVDE